MSGSIPSLLASANRIDLIFPGAEKVSDVWATARDEQIAVGAGITGDHDDFEDFGRGISEAPLAKEAFDHMIALLRKNGHLDAAA